MRADSGGGSVAATSGEAGDGAKWLGSWPAMRSGRFRLLVSGQLVSNAGDGVYAVALPWYVLSHHGSSVLLGVVLAAYGIPRTALLMVGGQLADKFGPARVMLGADVARLVLAGALAVIAAGPHLNQAALIAAAFGLGAGQGLFLPASFAVMPALVDDAALQSGNALMMPGTQIAMFAGPALGGLIVANTGAAAAFGLDAVSFAVSAATLLQLVRVGKRASGAPAGEDRTVAAAAAGGQGGLWAFCRGERVFLLLLAVTVTANLGTAGSAEVALPVFARGALHAGAAGYGVLIAGFGIGALAGSLAAARLDGGPRPATTAGFVFIVEAALLAALAGAGAVAVAVAVNVAIGVLNAYGNVMMQTVFQRWAPRPLLGRLSGVLLTASFGVFPVSVALAGVLVHRFGPGTFFVASGASLALVLVLALSNPAFRGFGVRQDEPVPAVQ
jgi:predicted MFS family arabinose efflux permease